MLCRWNNQMFSVFDCRLYIMIPPSNNTNLLPINVLSVGFLLSIHCVRILYMHDACMKYTTRETITKLYESHSIFFFFSGQLPVRIWLLIVHAHKRTKSIDDGNSSERTLNSIALSRNILYPHRRCFDSDECKVHRCRWKYSSNAQENKKKKTSHLYNLSVPVDVDVRTNPSSSPNQSGALMLMLKP